MGSCWSSRSGAWHTRNERCCPGRVFEHPANGGHYRGRSRGALGEHVGPAERALHGGLGRCGFDPGGIEAPEVHEVEAREADEGRLRSVVRVQLVAVPADRRRECGVVDIVHVLADVALLMFPVLVRYAALAHVATVRKTVEVCRILTLANTHAKMMKNVVVGVVLGVMMVVMINLFRFFSFSA